MLPIVNSQFNPLIDTPAAAENLGDKNLRQMTWLLAMEKQQLAEWLSHPFSDSSYSEGAVGNRNKEAEQDLFGTGAHRFMLRSADAEDAGSNSGEEASVAGSGAHRAETDSGVSGKTFQSNAAGPGRAAHAPASAASSQDVPEQQGAFIGGISARIAPDEAAPEDEAAAAAKDSGDRLVTISSDLQKMLSDLGLTKFQVGAAYAPPDEAETGLLLAAADENDIESDESANADADGAAANAEKTAASPVDNEKLRLHAELKNDEAHVWIGADRSLQLTGKHLDALTDQLQQMFSEQGTPLASLIFNGRPLIAMPSGDAARRSQKSQGNNGNQAQAGERLFAELDNEHFTRKP